ncbi:MAG: uroporphyrinogen-III C-methyltransferase [Acidimicrobiales bacterium]
MRDADGGWGVTVYLVGAGPGDPGLITVRGAEVLAGADVVAYDRLIDLSLLDLAPPQAERIDVGKSPGGPIAQDQINALLVERGLQGQEVVRLKGGDPFVLGRGGEEAAALQEAGVPFEVVPGISSAVAVPAYAGIPVTHRGLSTSFTVVTGHSRHATDTDVDWSALARAGGTLVVLMGVAHRSEIAARLIDGGLPPHTPVAAVRWGTFPSQQTVRATLERLPDLVLEPPVILVIGKVAGLDLRWFEDRPLLGRRIVLCRAAGQLSALTARLRRLGAEAVEVPTIEIADPADGSAALVGAAATVGSYDWLVLTSPNAVDRFFAHLRDARALGDAKVAAIGPGTAAALAARGVVTDLQPETSVAESLVEALGRGPGQVLLPQAAAARPVVADGLRANGWTVTAVEAYGTRPITPPPDLLAAAAKADAIAFTSSSTVENYVAAAGVDAVPPAVVCIGPITADTARRLGLTVTATAEQHDLDGLVSALAATLRPEPPAG